MDKKKEVLLAEQIIQLDLLRDQLYEELLEALGSKAPAFLRAVQNFGMEEEKKADARFIKGSA